MLLGVLHNDASLLTCRLAQIKSLLRFETDEPPDSVGAGYVENGQALVRRRPGTAPAVAADLLDLVSDVKATGMILHVRRATVGTFKDENTHPFRFQNWLFAHSGTVSGFGDLRPALIESLPEYLQRLIAGETDSEHIFAIFLDELRDAGALESLHVNPEVLNKAMIKTVERVEALASKVGAKSSSTLNIVATNGRGLVACCHGDDQQLAWAMLEGLEGCDLHDLLDTAPETHAQRVPHRNLRSLVVTSRARMDAGFSWNLLSNRQVLAVGPELIAHVEDY